MEIKDYINKNLTNLNWNILPQIFEENDVELTEEIEAYLRNSPENTNWNVLDGMSGSGEESWPKLIHVINNGGWKMADDSDFSTFAEAYSFIKNKWAGDESVSSDYVVLNHVNTIINSNAYIHNDNIEWYADNMIYHLTENSYASYDDN